jgi:hypothetical protein
MPQPLLLCAEKHFELTKRTSGLCSPAWLLAFTKDGGFIYLAFHFASIEFLYLSEAGERAFGPYENPPSFVRTSAREHANQIFVNGYMDLLVIRYIN